MNLFRLSLPFAVYAIYLFSPSESHAQNLSIGILAGAAPTDGFSAATLPDNIHVLSTSKDYLVGPTIQWRFSPSWSFEADGLFRELHFGRAGTQSNGTLGSVSPAPVVTWEFPMLAKYRLASWRVQPLVEGGPSFRTTGNLNGTNPSHYGFTAGIGVEMRTKALTFAPVVRYTRWAADSPAGVTYQARSNPNQLELAMGVSTAPESNGRRLNSHLSAGVLVGVGLTDDVRTTGFGFTSGTQSFNQTSSPRRGALLGPAFEAGLPAAFSVEVDALYVPLRSTLVTTVNGTTSSRRDVSIGNWDIPLLAKRRFRTRFIDPFFEAGPAFRVGTGQLSHYGITAGAGLETHVKRLKVAPTLRYSHWAEKLFSQAVNSNQLELYAAFMF